MIQGEDRQIQVHVRRACNCYRLEGHTARWYLGIVEAEKSDKLLISYMICTDSTDKVGLSLKLLKFYKLLLKKL